MMCLILEANYGFAILLMLFLAFGVPLLLVILGFATRRKNKKTSTILLIIAAVYSLIGLGFCGMLGF